MIDLATAAGLVRAHLALDLLAPEWRRRAKKAAAAGHPGADVLGHCYVASEALYHLAAREAGLRPHHVIHEGGSHWYLYRAATLTDPDDELLLLDLTAEQFATPVPYHRGVERAFLVPSPSRRTRLLLGRIFESFPWLR